MNAILKTTLVLTLAAFAAGGSTPFKAQEAAAADKVFDVPALLNTPLNAKDLKTSEEDGIITEEVMFHSEMDGEQSVDIFAYFSYPKGAQNLPAFIWNQPSLAQANTYWTILGAKRGYAALCIDFPIPGYRSSGDYPINSGLTVGDDPRQAPIYHGAVALLKAVSYLQSRPEVNKDRIGMAGSSWGGFYTTLMAGIDSRLKAASAMFGSGSLQLGNSWWDGHRKNGETDAALREQWRTTLDPAWRLPTSKVPIAWFSGTNDGFYWMPALNHSYQMANAPKHLSLMPNWDHGLPPQLDEQVFAWLDTHLKDAPAFLKITPIHLEPIHLEKKGRAIMAQWEFSGPRTATSAELILSYGEGNWPRRAWTTLPATMKDGACAVELPSSTIPFYISGTISDAKGFRYSTSLLKVEPQTFGKKPRANMLPVNGAATWGGFEEHEIRFLNGLAWAHPPVSNDARTGKQSVALVVGKNNLAPLLFTAGVMHRFSGFVKADKPTKITLEIAGQFDGQPKTVQREYSLSTQWTKITLDFLPPLTTNGSLQATLIAPENAAVVLDDVSFVPVWNEK